MALGSLCAHTQTEGTAELANFLEVPGAVLEYTCLTLMVMTEL